MNQLTAVALIASPLMLAIGQALFKSAAMMTPITDLASITGLLRTPTFYAALLVYAFATLVWIYVLSSQPLSRAYPFIALSFVFTPILAYLLFAEPLDLKYAVGTALLLAGVVVIGL